MDRQLARRQRARQRHRRGRLERGHPLDLRRRRGGSSSAAVTVNAGVSVINDHHEGVHRQRRSARSTTIDAGGSVGVVGRRGARPGGHRRQPQRLRLRQHRRRRGRAGRDEDHPGLDRRPRRRERRRRARAISAATGQFTETFTDTRFRPTTAVERQRDHAPVQPRPHRRPEGRLLHGRRHADPAASRTAASTTPTSPGSARTSSGSARSSIRSGSGSRAPARATRSAACTLQRRHRGQRRHDHLLRCARPQHGRRAHVLRRRRQGAERAERRHASTS